MTSQMVLKVSVSLMTPFLFAIAHDNNTSVSDINKDLKLISNWVFQWKMSYNQHLSMQPQEITKFSL